MKYRLTVLFSMVSIINNYAADEARDLPTTAATPEHLSLFQMNQHLQDMHAALQNQSQLQHATVAQITAEHSLQIASLQERLTQSEAQRTALEEQQANLVNDISTLKDRSAECAKSMLSLLAQSEEEQNNLADLASYLHTKNQNLENANGSKRKDQDAKTAYADKGEQRNKKRRR